MLGVPAISLPVLDDGGLPLGLQLMGFADRDAALFAVPAACWCSSAGRVGKALNYAARAAIRPTCPLHKAIAMKLAIPDMISNSYFPAVAAAELGFFKEEGLDVAVELIFPVDKAYVALRDGAVDFVGGSAHSALAAFPQWQGVKLALRPGPGHVLVPGDAQRSRRRSAATLRASRAAASAPRRGSRWDCAACSSRPASISSAMA